VTADAGAAAATARGQERFVLLDGLRGVAALAVAWLHAFQITGSHGRPLPNVALAVDFFFCLSGFVVAHAYDARLAQGMTLGAFMRRRLNRLYPMLAAGVVLGAAAYAWVHHSALERILREAALEALMLPVGLWGKGAPYALDPPMWSLLFEILGCLGYALLVKFSPSRWLPWLAAALGLMLAAATLVHGEVTGFGTSAGLGFYAGGLRVAYPFVLGVVAYRLDWRSKAPSVPPLLVFAALLVVLFWPFGPSGVFHALAALLFLPAILVMGARTSVRFESVWDALGRLSYPLYLAHWPVLTALHHFVGGRLPPTATMALGLALSVAIAWLVLLTYDEPIRRALAARARLAVRPARG
jgi:peptidoglycan/LPS O-acetylase OafA/YrhL